MEWEVKWGSEDRCVGSGEWEWLCSLYEMCEYEYAYVYEYEYEYEYESEYVCIYMDGYVCENVYMSLSGTEATSHSNQPFPPPAFPPLPLPPLPFLSFPATLPRPVHPHHWV